MDTPTLITLAGIVFGSQWLGTLLNKMYDNRVKKKDDPLGAMRKEVSEMREELASNSELTKSTARDRLNWLCNEYKSKGYIPEEDYESFKLLGDAYIQTKGNHGFDIKFSHIIETLPTK